MLAATSPIDVLDTFRVPYTINGRRDSPVGRVVATTTGAELKWLTPAAGVQPSWHELRGFPLFGAIVDDAGVERALGGSSAGWRPEDPIVRDGECVGHTWRAQSGSALLPFDPNCVMRSLLREEYVAQGRVTSAARSAYYALRPALPRSVQMALRRRFARVQSRTYFPRWPTETGMHDFQCYFLGLVEGLVEGPLPWMAPWPRAYDWAVVLTHDVEQIGGYSNIESVIAVERRANVRSAWYLVPERDYEVDNDVVVALGHDGFEVCIHGLRHDGRDLAPGHFDARLPAMLAHARRWGAIGFRAPATQRSWDMISRLGLDHDSSFSDIATYEPQPGGSFSLHPFFVGDVVELPITLPMDHTVFDLLGRSDAEVWFEKAETLRAREGLAMLLTHPDYMLVGERLSEYERFLTWVTADPTAWIALPREVSKWWRDRAASRLEADGTGWRIVGPAAADGRVVIGAPGAIPA